MATFSVQQQHTVKKKKKSFTGFRTTEDRQVVVRQAPLVQQQDRQ